MFASNYKAETRSERSGTMHGTSGGAMRAPLQELRTALAAELPGDAAERGRQRGAHLRLRVARQRGQGLVQLRRIPAGGARAARQPV
jgi:hypothetical protein